MSGECSSVPAVLAFGFHLSLSVINLLWGRREKLKGRDVLEKWACGMRNLQLHRPPSWCMWEQGCA